VRARFEIFLLNNSFRVKPVAFIGDDKLHFIDVIAKPIDVGPFVPRFLAGRGTLDVENHFGAWIQSGSRNVVTRFDEHFKIVIAQAPDQLKSRFLCEWLATCDFHQFATQ
jgi:hypothetical protein